MVLFMLILVPAIQAEPKANQPSGSSHAREESWIIKRKKYLIAGGAALAAGGILLAYLSSLSSDTKAKPAPAPLGNPPQDPVIQGSP